MRILKLATERTIMVLLVSSSDHVTGVEGASLTTTLSKDGGDFASISPTVTERGDGWYAIELTAAMTDTAGDLVLHVTASGADPADVAFEVSDQLSDVESGLTLRQAMRLIAAATAGKVSGASGTTITIRNAVADSADRIVATVDGDGNRHAITYNVS